MKTEKPSSQERKKRRSRMVLALVIVAFASFTVLGLVRGDVPGSYKDTVWTVTFAITGGWLCAPLLFRDPLKWKVRAIIEGVALVLYISTVVFVLLHYSAVYSELLATENSTLKRGIGKVLVAPTVPGLVRAFFFYLNVAFGRKPDKHLNPTPEPKARQQAEIRARTQDFHHWGKRFGSHALIFIAFLSAALAVAVFTSGHLADSPTHRTWAAIFTITPIWITILLRFSPEHTWKSRATILAVAAFLYAVIAVYVIMNYTVIVETTPETGILAPFEGPKPTVSTPYLLSFLCGLSSYLLFSSRRRTRRFFGVDLPEQDEDSE
ncbi:MAG: hypothetical protein E7Z96_02460 [Actinomycetaceae bacterium]|nr:hypothetical protein [Actinomycetaceae bacterium]